MRRLLLPLALLLAACSSPSVATSTTAPDECVEARVIYEEAAYEIGDLTDSDRFGDNPSFRIAVLRYSNVADLYPECFTPEERVRAATARDTLSVFFP